jgi:hypothetical protein
VRSVLGTARYWVPLAGSVACLGAVPFVGPVAEWLLIMAGFALLLDGATAMWERAGRTGNLSMHRQ